MGIETGAINYSSKLKLEQILFSLVKSVLIKEKLVLYKQKVPSKQVLNGLSIIQSLPLK